MKKEFIYNVDKVGGVPYEIAEQLREIHKANIGKQLRMMVTNERKRTTKQNSWFHLVNKLIADFMREGLKEQGDENYYKVNEETTKLWIKQKFLGYEEINGERHLRKTSKLKTFEMTELWGILQRHFAPKGLVIPDPRQDEDK